MYNNPELIFEQSVPQGKISWRSPSNIALVKYWGKRDVQIPLNPSISFTLSKSYTETTVEYSAAEEDEPGVQFFLEGEINTSFGEKISAYFQSIGDIYPFLKQLKFTIRSSNTFPHSAGIASSASGMSALALCLCSIEQKHFGGLDSEADFFQKASYLARLGSGSACRSLYGGLVSWGKVNGREETSDLWGTQQIKDVHPDFLTFNDSILIVDAAQKKVSSRIGHGLMSSNPFSSARFEQAQKNIGRLMDVLKAGDMDAFINITESEALTLHAMMMTSNPYYLLMKPNTLNIIERIFDFRKNTGTPLCFTLDAGPNIHLLYPEKLNTEVNAFIDGELKPFLHQGRVIADRVGEGPEKRKQ
ncbi:MAG: diphosphomevalonate decarboxylase [Bacteroidales bacterium]|nr:diphosphomevalonate decarboxylase [Bacteroidales bacterium]